MPARVALLLTLLALGCSNQEAKKEASDIDNIRQMMKSPDAKVRREAIGILDHYGERAKAALPEIIAALDDADDDVRVKASEVLWGHSGQNRNEVKAAIPQLCARLRTDKHKDVRMNAAGTLGSLEALPDDAVRALGEALKDPDADVRYMAAKSLETLGNTAGVAVPALAEALTSQDEQLRLKAAAALASIGSAARSALPALETMAKSGIAEEQSNAKHAINEIKKAK